MPRKILNIKSSNIDADIGNILRKLVQEKEARIFAEEIVATVREPLIVMDMKLKVVFVNKSFYRVFKAKPEDTIDKYIYDLGNNQWDIPRLKRLLENILPKNIVFEDFEVSHNFKAIGSKVMLLNARMIPKPPQKPKMILLAIEDITARKAVEKRLAANTRDLKIAVDERTAQLKSRVEELLDLNNVMIGREMKMIELKKEIVSCKGKPEKGIKRDNLKKRSKK